MAQRILPGAYVTMNDLSQVPEGQASLNVGYVLIADRGPVNKATLCTSFNNCLEKYFFGGVPSIYADPTIWELQKVFAKTNTVFVSRAANNPMYGGIVFTRADGALGNVISVSKADKKIIFEGTTALDGGAIITLSDISEAIDGTYNVVSSEVVGKTVVNTVSKEPNGNFVAGYIITSANLPVSGTEPNYTFTVNGQVTIEEGTKVIVSSATVTGNNKEYTVISTTINTEAGTTVIAVEESLEEGNDGILFLQTIMVNGGYPAKALTTSLPTPNYELQEGEIYALIGKDPGAYNGQMAFTVEQGDIYYVGADIGGVPCTFNTVELTIYNANTGEELESFLFSRDRNAKTIDGISLFIENVLANSQYVQVINGEGNELPVPFMIPIQSGAGSNGDEVIPETLVAALEPFANKSVSISILGNGSSSQAESSTFQQALLETAVNRKDCLVMLNSNRNDEEAQNEEERTQRIINYKKNLGSTSFYGAMYTPHVNTTDIYNQTQVKIGASGVAIAGWLDVVNNLGFPYAYAGPRNGLVTGVTVDWKIGDKSGIAQALNDASINFVAYDSKVGRYYMQCQNTLQVANSSMRNIGAVLNILDIKEHFETLLKEYIQLPITSSLRGDIYNTCMDYLTPMVGGRLYDFSFQDATTEADLADNTLRYLLSVALTPYSQKIFLVMNIVNTTFDFAITQSL